MPKVLLSQNFGTGGSPSPSVATVMSTSIALTTSWQDFAYTVTLPSILGKTLGTNDDDSLVLVIEFPLNETYNIDIAQVQLEKGSVATTFERRSVGEELSLCQRYYFKTFPIDVAPQQNVGNYNGAIRTYANASGKFMLRIDFPTAMRTQPAVTTYNPHQIVTGKVLK